MSVLMQGAPAPPAVMLLLPGSPATPEPPAHLLLLAADLSEPSSEGLTDPAADGAAEAGIEAVAADAADCLWASAVAENSGTLTAREPMPSGHLPTFK